MRNIKSCAYLLFILTFAIGPAATAWARLDDTTASTAGQKPLDLLDRKSVEFAMLDNPSQQLPWLRQQLKTLDPNKEPVAWVRACWTIALGYTLEIPVEEELAENSYYRQILDTCIQHAREQNLLLEWTGLSAFRENILRGADGFNPYAERMKQLIDEVRGLNDPESLAYILVEYSYELMLRKIIDKSLPYIIEANDLLESRSVSSLLVVYQTRGALCMNLNYRGQLEEAIRVNEASAAMFKANGMRHAAAEMTYNTGYGFLHKDPPDDASAKAKFLDAIDLTSSLTERLIKASALLQLSIISSHELAHEKAMELAQEAWTIFTEEKDEFWAARSQVRMAEVFIDLQNFRPALPLLDEASKGFDEEAKDYRNTVLWLRYKAYLGLQDIPNAFRNLELYTLGFQEYSKFKEKQEYNKAAAMLGLQLEKEKSRSLQKDKEQLLWLIGFGGLGMIIMVYALIQSSEVRRQKKNMRSVLENVGEGIVKFGKDGLIDDNYSRHLPAILGETENIAGTRILDLLYKGADASGEERNRVENTLQMILGEAEVAWDLNSGNLPKEMTRAGKVLSLIWTPIHDKSRYVEHMMLVLKDITQSRELEREVTIQKTRIETLGQQLSEIMRVSPKSLPVFMKSLRFHAAEIEQTLNGKAEPEFNRSLHTFKGEARTLGLTRLAGLIHDLESALQEKPNSLAQQDILEQLKDMCGTYISLLESMPVPAAEPSEESSLAEIASQAINSLRSHLHKNSYPLEGIFIEDRVRTWTGKSMDWAQTLILHGLINAADHGFLIPKSKGCSTQRPAAFTIKAWTDITHLRLEISDNGSGINWNFVNALAAKRQYQPEPSRPLTDVLFFDGVSSATELSQSSGRGVGLAAIRSACLQLRGTVSLLDNTSGVGTVLRAEIPMPMAAAA